MAINLRSPHYVSTAVNNTSYTELEIYIWEGLSTDTTTVKYNLKKYAINGSNFVAYDVSELIRDFLDITFNGNYAGKSIWFKEIIKVYNSSGVLLLNFAVGRLPSIHIYSTIIFSIFITPYYLFTRGVLKFLFSDNII